MPTAPSIPVQTAALHIVNKRGTFSGVLRWRGEVIDAISVYGDRVNRLVASRHLQNYYGDESELVETDGRRFLSEVFAIAYIEETREPDGEDDAASDGALTEEAQAIADAIAEAGDSTDVADEGEESPSEVTKRPRSQRGGRSN